ncbi:MAG TPA: S8 family serine peptidase [Blastocatellia bacterium]|nr:S8 family serine peptidase [Blastocatellia bacterium]
MKKTPDAVTLTDVHAHTHALNRFAVMPVAERLRADVTRTGRGVTIAFLDSGFYLHPDLTEPHNRILACHDVTQPEARCGEALPPQVWDWHGTQTAVTAAGNGFLSDGLYRGLASDAMVVLVKVSERGRITDDNIIRGLDWVIENRERFGIRIASLSLGGDVEATLRESQVNAAAERAVAAGITVVVAAGNAGCTSQARPVPPASAPSVITVGGYNDHNQPEIQEPDPYCSSFGPTIDGLLKPEIVAPAIQVAAPILPDTGFYRQAEALSLLAAAPDYQLSTLAAELWLTAELPVEIASASPAEIREAVEARLRESKIVATHYQHVDGTSFAAPIVASVIAQMLEANSKLTPRVIRNILIATADRSPRLALQSQGYGVLNARRAVAEAARETHTHEECDFNAPRIENGELVFWYHNDAAQRVALAGDFNGWNPSETWFARHSSGMWRAALPPLPPGTYQYKFVINGERWLDDPGNSLKLEDQHGGFNSVLHIAQED